MTCKIHELIFNIPRFVNNWKTTGILSEQEGEFKHAAVNAELCSLACVQNHAEKIRLVIERARSDKSAMKPNPCLCENCKINKECGVFFRFGKDDICKPENLMKLHLTSTFNPNAQQILFMVDFSTFIVSIPRTYISFLYSKPYIFQSSFQGMLSIWDFF